MIVAAIAVHVTSIGSKNQHAGELPNGNKKLTSRLLTSIEAKHVHSVPVLSVNDGNHYRW